ncbi:MAG TPA: hypothetical protein VM509_07720, partial [Planctomycetota bacterium]|nr:hypothetical protein [Planctomycetota bacterium]
SGLVQQLQTLPFLKWVREAYFEGNIEVLDHGQRHVGIDALYVDLAEGHGWIRDFILTMDTPFRSASKHLKLHADWLSFEPDGSARASNAVATSCEFDDPHYVVTLGDMRIKPKTSSRKSKPGDPQGAAGEPDGYDVRSKNNSVKIGNSPKIPIPEIAFPMDSKFRVPPESLTFFGIRGFSFGNIAKFGAFLGFSFDFGLGSASKTIGRVLAGSSDPPKGHNTANVKYLNKRGLLVNGENEIELPNVYKLATRLALVGDNGRDRGLVRVPEDEREMLRTWLRLEGRRWLGKNEWFDLNLTKQSDPGVQAEFFERDFVRWEERETYVHYRKARGLDDWRATVETQLDDHRTEVLEEPSFGYTRSRGPIARWWGRDVVYTSDSTVAHLRRVEPVSKVFNEAPFADTFGEQEVVRLDTLQRLERPMPLDVLDARLVPFLEARGTGWDRSPVGSDSPTRFGLFAGAELSTTFWRMFDDGDLHTLTPTIGFRTDVAFEENGDRPALFDAVEDPIDGQVTEFGLRSSWVKPLDFRRPDMESRFLDVEVREAYATHMRDPAREEGWQPLRVNGRWLTEIAGVPFGATHDARYDLDDNETIYSRSAVGVRPLPPLEFETSFNTARDLLGDRLYSAWRVSARYNYSDKWQFEGSETISTLSGNELGSSFTLRRIGHDFIVEIEYSFTAGEGGSSISFNLLPLLLYREHSLGLLKPMQAQGN